LKFSKITSLLIFSIFLLQNTIIAAPTLSVKPSNTLKLSIPKEFGVIKEQIIASPEAPLLIHIQDAHANLDAQENIQNILYWLQERHGINQLFLEGGVGKLNPELMRLFDNPKWNQELAADLMKQGEMSGAEAFLISPKATMKSYGIENREDYRKNRELFNKILNQEKLREEWRKLSESIFNQFISQSNNKNLKLFLKEWLLYKQKPDELSKFIDYISEASKQYLDIDFSESKNQFSFPNLVRMSHIIELSKNINPDLANSEKELLIQSLSKAVKPELLNLFNDIERLEKPRHLVEQLFELTDGMLDFNAYPNFHKQTKYFILKSEIDAHSLFDEIQRVNQQLFSNLKPSNRDVVFFNNFKKILLLKELFRLEITREQFNKISNSRNSFSPKQILTNLDYAHKNNLVTFQKSFSESLNFYELAIKREKAFIQNSIKRAKQNRSVMIAGGFHSKGIKNKILSRGYSYIEIIPNIGSVENSREVYLKSILGDTFRYSQISNTSELNSVQTQISLGGLIQQRLKAIFVSGIATLRNRAGNSLDLKQALAILRRTPLVIDNNISLRASREKNGFFAQVDSLAAPIFIPFKEPTFSGASLGQLPRLSGSFTQTPGFDFQSEEDITLLRNSLLALNEGKLRDLPFQGPLSDSEDSQKAQLVFNRLMQLAEDNKDKEGMEKLKSGEYGLKLIASNPLGKPRIEEDIPLKQRNKQEQAYLNSLAIVFKDESASTLVNRDKIKFLQKRVFIGLVNDSFILNEVLLRSLPVNSLAQMFYRLIQKERKSISRDNESIDHILAELLEEELYDHIFGNEKLLASIEKLKLAQAGLLSRDLNELDPNKPIFGIIGTGVSALSSVTEIKKKYPEAQFVFFEANPLIGGKVVYAIPSHRSNIKITYISGKKTGIANFIDREGHHLFIDFEVGNNPLISAEEFFKLPFDGLIFAAGNQEASIDTSVKRVFIQGKLGPGIYTSTQIYRPFNREKMNLPDNEVLFPDLSKQIIGKDISVIGGGNVSLDIVRFLLENGARNVRLIYRRGQEVFDKSRDPFSNASQTGGAERRGALGTGVHYEMLSGAKSIIRDQETGDIIGIKLAQFAYSSSQVRRVKTIPELASITDMNSFITQLEELKSDDIEETNTSTELLGDEEEVIREIKDLLKQRVSQTGRARFTPSKVFEATKLFFDYEREDGFKTLKGNVARRKLLKTIIEHWLVLLKTSRLNEVGDKIVDTDIVVFSISDSIPAPFERVTIDNTSYPPVAMVNIKSSATSMMMAVGDSATGGSKAGFARTSATTAMREFLKPDSQRNTSISGVLDRSPEEREDLKQKLTALKTKITKAQSLGRGNAFYQEFTTQLFLNGLNDHENSEGNSLGSNTFYGAQSALSRLLNNAA